ncbi:hypothetical protein RE428_02620 [Marinobacter nanhaiticus D15-8W]|nr:hypothetical protein RE428_02620 [Marinobacter nanhaiticus D15-8W]
MLILVGLVGGRVSFAAANGCGAPYTRISAIQGDGDRSPVQGQTLAVEGVITLEAGGPDGLAGFYLQSLPGDADRDAATSEGLFVFSDDGSGDVGDHVRVRGLIKEYHGLTEIAARGRLKVCGRAPAPQPIALSFPLPTLEPLEGMRVVFDEAPTVIDTHDLGRYGVVELAADDPVRSRRNPDTMGSPDRILLDDRRLVQNPATLPLPRPGLSADNSLRTGSRLEPVRGVLDYRYDRWRIQPETWPSVLDANERPVAPEPPKAGAVRVAAFNALNFFNGDGEGDGFPTARGADTGHELRRQRQKLVAAIHGLKADIVGLMELENDGSGENSAIAELTRSLGAEWRYIRQPEAGTDAIRVGLIYRHDRAQPAGAAAVLASGVFARYSRAPAAQDFRLRGNEDRIRVVVNHFKSRSCRNARGENRVDDEGCYAPVRERSARELLAWLETLPKPEGLSGALVVGDLNTYVGERPLALLAGGGFQRPTPLTGDGQHTYRFDGVRGVLDYILVDEHLQSRVVDGGVWHINADEPSVLDYNLEFHPPGRADRLYGPGPWRSSDHDPVYLDVRMDRR